MSTEFKVQPPVAYSSLLQAGCKRDVESETDLGRTAHSHYFPMQMPNNHWVWVNLMDDKVYAFTRFGGNDPEWIISFFNEHGSRCVSEHEDDFWLDDE